MSGTLTPIFGEKFKDGIIGKIIDIVVVFGIIASITTSLGLGVPVMSKLISSVLHIKDGLSLQIAVYLIWFMIFGWSVFRGLE